MSLFGTKIKEKKLRRKTGYFKFFTSKKPQIYGKPLPTFQLVKLF